VRFFINCNYLSKKKIISLDNFITVVYYDTSPAKYFIEILIYCYFVQLLIVHMKTAQKGGGVWLLFQIKFQASIRSSI
jgi:hypothetical protein